MMSKNCDFSLNLKTDDPNENYDFLTNTFINIVNNNAHLKNNFIRGNQTPFVTRNLRKNFVPELDLEINFVSILLKKMKNYKKQRNKCIALRRKCIKEYVHNISNNNIVTNKIFWNFIRPFLINKGLLNSSEIMLRKGKKIITDTRKIVQILNVMRCAIWYQTLKNGVRMVGQKTVVTSQNASEWLSQESVSLNPFAWHSNSHLTFNHSHGI